MKTIKLEELDLTNYTTKQIESLKKGWDIYVSGTLGGSWDDEEWGKENYNNSDYEYFYDTFKNTDLFIGWNSNTDKNYNKWNKMFQIVKNTFRLSGKLERLLEVHSYLDIVGCLDCICDEYEYSI